MNMNCCLRYITVFLLAAGSLNTNAAAFFTDNFSSGSTTNKVSNPGGTPAASSTSYDFASSKNTTTSTIGANLLSCKLTTGTSSGYWEVQALFATNAVSLNSAGDYIDLAIVFTNTTGALLTNGASSSAMWIGLYNSGAAPGTSNPPVANALLANGGLTTTASSPYATGNCQPWSGYIGQVRSGSAPNILNRPPQYLSGTTSANQELLGNNVSSGTFNNPQGTNVVTGPSQSFVLAVNSAYTLDLRITLDPAGSGNLLITNAIYAGAGTGGTVVFLNATNTANLIATAFDGLAFGYFQKTLTLNPQMDVSSITVTGQSSPPVPPTINTQPVPVLVATNASCMFMVSASGNDLSYQWHRNGTNLANGGNISGANNSMLVISAAGTSDELSDTAGYYVTVFGAGNLSTLSVTNSLALVPATNLVYSGSGPWDVNTSPSWQDTNAVPTTGLLFTYGDPVIFDDTGGGGTVNLNGPYLSAASVIVNSGSAYTFSGSGSFAGPGGLLYEGGGQLTLNNANSYTGGTIISNPAAVLRLQNYGGLGAGPVTLAGGTMEIVNSGAATVGINGDLILSNDFTIKYDANSSFGAVFLGNLVASDPARTLTITYNGSGSTPSRVRVLGGNMTFNSMLNLNGSLVLYAPYQSSGSQTYNGVISGTGAMMHKGTITYFNGANTYSGGMNISAGAIGLGIDSVSSQGSVSSGPIGTGPLLLTVDSTTSSTGNGQVFAAGGARLLANDIQFPSGTNNLTLVVGGANDLTFQGKFSLNGQDNVTTNAITARTVQVTNTAATTFAGVIDDNAAHYGLIKTGAGALYLNGANTYLGATTNNSSTTNAPGLLAGNGSISGDVFIQTNSSIGGGSATAIGTLSVGGNLTIAGNGYFRVNRSGFVSDEVSVTGGLTNVGAGAIVVTNLGGALQAGDTFTLFSKPMTNGAALTVTGAGMNWANKLAVDGTIQALAAIASYPTNITFSLSGATLSVGWPATHLGWILQRQTNSLGVGLRASSNLWVDVAGSGGGTNSTLTINPTNPAVFLRLRHP